MGCEAFCLEDEAVIQETTSALQAKTSVTAERLKLAQVSKESHLSQGERNKKLIIAMCLCYVFRIIQSSLEKDTDVHCKIIEKLACGKNKV